MEKIKFSESQYLSWESDLTQTLGYYKMPAYPINPKNAKAFIEKWLEAPLCWRKRFVSSPFHQKEFTLAVSKLEDDWHERPKNALDAIASRMAVIGGFTDNDSCVYVKYQGFSFVLKVNAAGIKIFFGKTDCISYPIRNGIGDVAIPSAYVVAVIAEYLKSMGYTE